MKLNRYFNIIALCVLELSIIRVTSAGQLRDDTRAQRYYTPRDYRNTDIYSRISFQCNDKTLNFLNASCKALRHKQITLTSTLASMNESLDLLSNDKFIAGVKSTPKVFIINIEIESGWRRLKNKWQKYLQKCERPLALYFKTPRKETEMIYYLNGDDKLEHVWFEEKMNVRRLREMLDSKFTLENLMYYLRYVPNKSMNATSHYAIMTQAINVNCSLCIRILNAYLVNFNATDYLMKYSRIIAPKFNRETMYALLDLPFNFSQRFASKRTFDPIRKSREILVEAVEGGNIDGVKFLIGIEYFGDQDWDNNTATTVAWNHEHFDIFVLLIKNDFPYPDNFAELLPLRSTNRNRDAVIRLNDHIRRVQQLHDDIRDGSYDRIEKFIHENRKLKYARDVDNILAIVTAVYSKNLDVIALLNANNMMPYDNGAARHIVNHIYSFNDDEIAELQKMNIRYLHNPSEDYITKLHERSLIKFDPAEVDAATASREILHAFMDLHSHELTSPIIEFAAKCTHLQIVIDLSSRFTFRLSPVSYTSSGLTNEKENRVYIGAKDILDPKNRDVALGIIIHELMHYVMYLMYHNDAKPYTKWDPMTRKYFEMIEDVYKSNDRHEGQWMVKMFQKYEPEQHQSELIARAVDLPILYRTNSTGMEEVRRAYRDLFEFYEYKTLPDIKYRMWSAGISIINPHHSILVSFVEASALIAFTFVFFRV